MSKYSNLQESSISKYALTERKASRGGFGQFEGGFEKDYELEKQYLEKLRAQRIKAEKLFEEYTNVTKEYKREKEIGSRLREEIQELRNMRSVETEKTKGEISSLRIETEQQKMEIKSLLADKSTLIKKFKEYEGQLEYIDSLKDENEQVRSRARQLQQRLCEIEKQHDKVLKANEELIQQLREKNLALEKEKLLISKQSKRQKEERGKLQQQKTRWQQIIAQKTSAFEKLVGNYEEELRIKEKTYEKMVGQLQESNKYWTTKYEQKSKQLQCLKKAYEEHKESLRKGKEELDSLRFRLTQKQRKYEILQKDLTQCYTSLREKEQQFKQIQITFQTNLAIRQKESGRLKDLEQENNQLKLWVEEYQAIMESKRRRELEHQELVEDEIEEIRKIENIFRNIE